MRRAPSRGEGGLEKVGDGGHGGRVGLEQARAVGALRKRPVWGHVSRWTPSRGGGSAAEGFCTAENRGERVAWRRARARGCARARVRARSRVRVRVRVRTRSRARVRVRVRTRRTDVVRYNAFVLQRPSGCRRARGRQGRAVWRLSSPCSRARLRRARCAWLREPPAGRCAPLDAPCARGVAGQRRKKRPRPFLRASSLRSLGGSRRMRIARAWRSASIMRGSALRACSKAPRARGSLPVSSRIRPRK